MAEITVLMPVKNGSEFIKESIDSILNQTYKDFELLIIDDGSEDNTVEIIESYDDSRIRLERRPSNFIENLNEGILLSQGKYIARMDADDIMHSERLRIQLKRMKRNPDIAICSSWIKVFNAEGDKFPPVNIGEYYIDHPIIHLLKNNFVHHPSVMLNKEFLIKHDLFYQDYPYAEDYKFWFEIIKCGGKLFIEPQHLISFRKSEKQITVVKQKEMIEQTKRIKQEMIDYFLENMDDNKLLKDLYTNLQKLIEHNLITWEMMFQLFHSIILKKHIL